MNKKYSELSGQKTLKTEDLFALKAGFTCYSYGCQSYVCSTNRGGAKDLCTTAYCVSGVGPVSNEGNETFIRNE